MSVVFLAGLALRLRLAYFTYFNPDEALHAILSFGGWREVWDRSLADIHPPLLLLITHLVSFASRTELALRMAPVLAGSLFPVLVYSWLRRVAGATAAMAAMFLLTLAPHLISISAQLRSYTLALLFLSASLVALEEAIERGSPRLMWSFNVLLWACILSDYSATVFAVAAGVYALLRLRGSPASVKLSWAAGQAVALGLYVLLFLEFLRPLIGTGIRSDLVDRSLRSEFPVPGARLAFPFTSTRWLFRYFAGSPFLGVMALVLFGIGLILLWSGRAGLERHKSRALAMLVTVPFALLIAAAYSGLYPYGGTRHTAVAAPFAACGIAIVIGTMRWRAAMATLWGALALAPIWYQTAQEDPEDISANRSRREMMRQGLAYMHASIPAGGIIFTDGDTQLMLSYYEGGPIPTPHPGRRFVETDLAGGWRVLAGEYSWTSRPAYETAMAAFREDVPHSAPVWVVDGGWFAVAGSEDPSRPFTKTIRVFQADSP